MSDKTFNKPPEVVMDDHGIAAWVGGALTYYIRWSEIRTIQIAVIGYGGRVARHFGLLMASNQSQTRLLSSLRWNSS